MARTYQEIRAANLADRRARETYRNRNRRERLERAARKAAATNDTGKE